MEVGDENTWFTECLQMYQDSFKHLRTDYFDYYLFHILGTE